MFKSSCALLFPRCLIIHAGKRRKDIVANYMGLAKVCLALSSDHILRYLTNLSHAYLLPHRPYQNLVGHVSNRTLHQRLARPERKVLFCATYAIEGIELEAIVPKRTNLYLANHIDGPDSLVVPPQTGQRSVHYYHTYYMTNPIRTSQHQQLREI